MYDVIDIEKFWTSDAQLSLQVFNRVTQAQTSQNHHCCQPSYSHALSAYTRNAHAHNYVYSATKIMSSKYILGAVCSHPITPSWRFPSDVGATCSQANVFSLTTSAYIAYYMCAAPWNRAWMRCSYTCIQGRIHVGGIGGGCSSPYQLPPFSALKIVNNFLRNRMTDERLYIGLALI
jgi:hypothetical protein